MTSGIFNDRASIATWEVTPPLVSTTPAIPWAKYFRTSEGYSSPATITLFFYRDAVVPGPDDVRHYSFRQVGHVLDFFFYALVLGSGEYIGIGLGDFHHGERRVLSGPRSVSGCPT